MVAPRPYSGVQVPVNFVFGHTSANTISVISVGRFVNVSKVHFMMMVNVHHHHHHHHDA